LRHHPAGGPPDHLTRSLRGGRHRRRQHDPALLAHHDAAHQAGADHRDDVLDHLHVLRLPAAVHPDSRRAGERHAPVRHLRVRDRHDGRPARNGGRGGAGHAARARRAHRGLDRVSEAGVMVGARNVGARTLRLYLPLGFFLVTMLFPFYWMAITSIKPNRELYNARIMPLIVHQPVLKHYVDLLSQTNFLTWTYNTLLVAVVTTVVSLVLGTMIAYPL